MASRKRSVWEIRFYALRELILMKQRQTKEQIANDFINSKTIHPDWRVRSSLLATLNKRAAEIESQNINRIFLSRDY